MFKINTIKYMIKDYSVDFPLLAKSGADKVLYFDNACMSLKPRAVVEAMADYYYNYPACAGRSAHRLSDKATKAVQAARQTVANFLSAKSVDNIIFTRNTTEAINLVAKSFSWQAGDVILTTDKEHNSNLVPWQLAAREHGLIHRVLPSLADNSFDLEAYRQAVQGVRLVAMVATSNLDGVSNPIEEIIKIAHQAGALVLLDAAQAAAQRSLDVVALDVDFLALSGHKLCGPTGTGVLYAKPDLLANLKPFWWVEIR
jgi:cysteine desulfurase/selenocysteine lyase